MARKPTYQDAQPYALPDTARPRGSGSSVPADIMWPRILILLATFALLLIGFVMVYSASSIVALYEGDSTSSYLIKQLVFAVIGIAGAFVIWKLIPYHIWTGPFVWISWGLSLALLLLTAAMGNEGFGAQRWIDIGPFGLQPSEFAKIAFLLMAARILHDFRNGDLGFKGLIAQAAILILIPLIFLYRSQSDLGTTLICFAGILMVMWLGEVPLKIILGVVVAGLLFAVVASTVGYRQDRFMFINPWDDGEGGLGAGYQLIHSYYAFSEGGLFGVGLGNSREKFLYLPMSETDFIYAIIGEELGLFGALLVIALFLVFLYAGMRIARGAPDNFAMTLAGGFTVMIVFQAFLNIGCVIGVLPTTGKPLPFISSGGSSLIASLFMFGIIMSISQASDAPSIYEQRRADLRVVRMQRPSDPLPGSASARRPSNGYPPSAYPSNGRTSNGRASNARAHSNRPSNGRASSHPINTRPANSRPPAGRSTQNRSTDRVRTSSRRPKPPSEKRR